MSMNYNDLTNSELKIKLIEIENESEVARQELEKIIIRIQNLDNKYQQINDVLNKRTKGVIR